MTRMRFLPWLLAGLLACAATAPAEARRDRDDRPDRPDRHARRDAPRSDGMSLDEAVARVRRETGGRVLSAEARESRGAVTYRIKVLLSNGAVRVYHLDARGGGKD